MCNLKLSRALFLFGLGAIFSSSPLFAALDTEQLFALGAQSLKSQQYEKAIHYFQLASEQGLDKGKLHHAWGSALYHDRQYQAARVQFEQAARTPEFGQLAHLNLGLVAIKLRQDVEAERQFRLAYNGDSPTVTRMAGEMLRRMEVEVSGDNQPLNSLVYISTRAGYEDRTYDPSNEQSGNSDQFGELNIYLAQDFWSRKNSTFKAGTNFFTLQKNTNTSTELTMLMAELMYEKNFKEVVADTSLEVSRTNLGGNPYLNVISPDLSMKWMVSESTNIRWQLAYEDVTAASNAYTYLEGSAIKSKLQARTKLGNGFVYVQYKLDREDHAGLYSGADYYDYSPIRHAIKFAYQLPVWINGKVVGDIRYRSSEYDKPHHVAGEFKVRKDDQIQFGAKASYQIGTHLSLTSRYQHTRNRSNWTRYTYDRNEFSLGIEWLMY